MVNVEWSMLNGVDGCLLGDFSGQEIGDFFTE